MGCCVRVRCECKLFDINLSWVTTPYLWSSLSLAETDVDGQSEDWSAFIEICVLLQQTSLENNVKAAQISMRMLGVNKQRQPFLCSRSVILTSS
jgi:hypothetical protein